MTVFERYPKTTLFSISLIMCTFALMSMEWGAKTFFGLGKVVIYDNHPLYGYRLKPNQTVSRTPGKIIHVNNLGLRAEQDWDQNTHHKVLFLGDSVTYGGSYIANSELFSELAVKPFPTWMAGNAAVNGWGISNVNALVTQTHFLPADVVVSVFPEGDFYRGVNKIGGQPFWSIQPRFALEELLHYGIYKLHLSKTPSHFSDLSENEKVQIAESAAKDLKALDDYLKSQGKTHLIYITPTQRQVLDNAPVDPLIKPLLEKYNLNVVYLVDRLPNVSASEKSSWFHDNIHLSKEGHQQWASLINDDLKKVLS